MTQLLATAALLAALSQPGTLPQVDAPVIEWNTAHTDELPIVGWKDLLRPPLEEALPLDPPKEGAVIGAVEFVIPTGDPVERWRPMVCSYNWGCQGAMNVLRCESHGDPRAYSAGNYGLMQINAVHAWRVGGDPQAFWNPEINVRVAHDIWVEHLPNGWGPWGCRP